MWIFIRKKNNLARKKSIISGKENVDRINEQQLNIQCIVKNEESTNEYSIIENIPLVKFDERRTKYVIKMVEYVNYYKIIKANAFVKLIEEYVNLHIESKSMEKQLKLTMSSGKDSMVSNKNKFIDIIPFDNNRVKIGKKGFPRDYINASYIPFINNDEQMEYIAAQHPNEHNLSHFWQMIWEQNINIIISFIENNNENTNNNIQYWPTNISENIYYGDKNQFNVVLISINNNDNNYFIENEFLINYQKNEEKSRKIIQLQIQMRMDSNMTSFDIFDNFLLRFYEITNNNTSYPILIHCSTGIGETGVILCIDRIIKMIHGGFQEINIFDIVLTLRQHRTFMVQLQNQYLFIYHFINYFTNKYSIMETINDYEYDN